MFVQAEGGLRQMGTAPEDGGPPPRKLPTFWLVKPA